MANRAYLYSLSKHPTAYTDRPETLSGLSEWPYGVPFSYRVLMSGAPRLCASLIADGFDGEPAHAKTKLYAISADFEIGYARLKRFFAILRPLVADAAPALIVALDETLAFLELHRDRYLLLETIEIDTMRWEQEADLRRCVEQEIAECQHVGAAIDALPSDLQHAGIQLIQATGTLVAASNNVFHGLRLDNDFDNTRDNKTQYPLGLFWSDVLYFQPLNARW